MARALTVCNRFGCSTPVPQGQGRCDACRAEAERRRRPGGNPYASAGHLRFREAVLRRDEICVVCEIRVATHADHFPLERVELIELGKNPNDPAYGRGLCEDCHNRHTAATRPGGWHAANRDG